jgi:hypothetical protein
VIVQHRLLCVGESIFAWAVRFFAADALPVLGRWYGGTVLLPSGQIYVVGGTGNRTRANGKPALSCCFQAST